MKTQQRLLTLALTLLLSACGALVQSTTGDAALDAAQPWVVLPLVNNTDTAQAALSAEALVEHQLRARGLHNLTVYPATLSRDSLFEPSERKVVQEAQVWAKAQGARYGVSGSVQEWRYKVGVDGEPAVGLTLNVIDLASGKVVWSTAGSRSGWGRDSLAGTAQALVVELIAGMQLGK